MFHEWNHPFHRFQDRCLQAVLSLPAEEFARRYGATTNVMKIGASPKTRGNPVGPLADLQRGDRETFLDLEIRSLNPTGIVFLTDEYEWDLVERIVFGGGKRTWEKRVLPQALWIATRGSARVYATYHPQWMQRQSGLAERVIAAIAANQRRWRRRT